MGKIVAIDYGKKKLGLAISDSSKKIALPLQPLLASKKMEETLSHLKKLFEERGDSIEKIILGLPLHLSGEESPMCQEVRKFGLLIEKELALGVHYLDERFTSRSAHASLKSVNMRRKKREELLDSTSAMIILQNYLDLYEKR